MNGNKIDAVLEQIADYVHDFKITNPEIYRTAALSLADSLGCAILSLRFPECTKLLGPIVPGTIVPNGSHVPGTDYVLDPIRAAFNIGTMIRWLDFNDTFLAAEWGHPSDNFGGILALTDFISRSQKKPISVKEVLTAAIKAYEIQGGLALLNSFNKIGIDHVILVKVATAAIATHLLGGTKQQIMNAVSNAWIDVGPLRTYRHVPNTGSRKSWAAGDATSRGVMLAWMTMQGEMGYSTPLTAKKWGLYDVLFQGKPFSFQRPFGSYVMEHILFKIAFPAEFHAQTAVECAIQLHRKVANKLDQIETIQIFTHESAIKIIDKKGPLNNPADRDHCLQYIVAIGLIYGHLAAEHYEDETAQNKLIDELRDKTIVTENKRYSLDYHDPEKRSIANAIQIKFKDGSTTPHIEIEYPLGHKRRRNEGIPLLFEKFANNLKGHCSKEKIGHLIDIFQDQEKLEQMPLSTLVDMVGVS